ncbi:MAG: glycoside hydrolase family 97 protein [Bacteroidales bacterium]|nr:glycoside hydrolase family 97 protein [Bacteroidales bacterium]MBN2820443.1 glycoside hydrolase family 97 protein [Bacteroidales bacterium]
MIKLRSVAAVLISVLFFTSCMKNKELFVQSPDGKLKVSFEMKDNKPVYKVKYNNFIVINESLMGLVLSDSDTLLKGMQIAASETKSVDTTWEQLWGQNHMVENKYNQLIVKLNEPGEQSRQVNIIFKVYNDGLGFRYEVPEQENLGDFIIIDELTEFAFNDNHTAWWIPAYGDNRYEYLYKKSALNDLDTVHTPLTMEAGNGLHISIHEANLTNYASMTLAHTGHNKLKCDLVPWSDGTKVKTKAPMQTPWRTIQIAENAGGLITSNLILNLNDENKLDDTSWIKPLKYMGIWWGMHIGKYSFWESPNHGASTKNAKYYIDFASEHGIHYLLIEGWNKGWTPAWYENLLHVFSFTQCTDDFNFEEVTSYAKSKGVEIIGYHETGSNINNYLTQIDDGMKMYADAGMHNIKIGQVGSRMQMKEWHHGQYGVEYYRFVLEKAADYKLAVNFHEPIKPTGLRRTMPNLMAGEGARGQEYNAWSEGNPPEHTCILPFTRLLGGPMDFTPGIFSIKPTRVHTTLAKQLALYLTIYSPIQMLADLPENYDNHPAFKFLQDVPVDWKETKVLEAKIGDYLTTVRKDKNSDDWYLGSITDENARQTKIELNFLEPGAEYMATIYGDADDAAFDTNPEAYKIDSLKVNSQTTLDINIAPGGGCAIQFKKL